MVTLTSLGFLLLISLLAVATKASTENQYLRREEGDPNHHDEPEVDRRLDACWEDSECPDGMYCEEFTCYHGVLGDPCKHNSDCGHHNGLGDLSCQGAIDKICQPLGEEGDGCTEDADCEGYCQGLKCWDGSEGDDCRQESDCQGDDLTCIGTPPFAKCRRQKNEGEWCGHNDDCKGYCQFLKCWDGSKGDKCKYHSECQGSLSCKKRCRICAQKICK